MIHNTNGKNPAHPRIRRFFVLLFVTFLIIGVVINHISVNSRISFVHFSVLTIIRIIEDSKFIVILHINSLNNGDPYQIHNHIIHLFRKKSKKVHTMFFKLIPENEDSDRIDLTVTFIKLYRSRRATKF